MACAPAADPADANRADALVELCCNLPVECEQVRVRSPPLQMRAKVAVKLEGLDARFNAVAHDDVVVYR